MQMLLGLKRTGLACPVPRARSQVPGPSPNRAINARPHLRTMADQQSCRGAAPPPAAGSPPACPAWARQHLEMGWENRQLAALAQRGPYSLAFLGDSITAGLAGGGRKLGKKLEAAEKALRGPVGIFGIPGDKVENLMWRLGNGGLPTARVYCVQIGTNDVWLRERPAEIAGRIRELAGYLRAAAPESHVVLLSLFWLCEKEQQRRAINQALRSFAARAGDPRLHYSDAGEQLPMDLFPDGVHPEPEAWDRVLDALLPFVKELS